MRGNDFLDKIELIDPAYMEAADVMPKKKKLWTGWRAAAAACICLVLLAGTAAAVSGGRTWLVELFTRESGLYGTESGYTIGAEIRKFPMSELSEEIQAVSGEFVDQSWREEFTTAEEARAFIGIDSLKLPELDIGEPWDAALLVRGSQSRNIEEIDVITGYNVGDIVLQTEADIYTEYADDAFGNLKVVMPEGTEFTESSYTTVNGNLCRIISFPSSESGRFWLSGHLVDGGILYTAFVNYPESDAIQAEALLHQWADLF